MIKSSNKRQLKQVILQAITSLSALVVLPFIMIRIAADDWLMAAIDFIFVSAMVSLFVYVRKTNNVILPSFFITGFAIFTVVSSVIFNGLVHIFWAYPVVIGVFYLFRHGIAIVINLAFMAAIAVIISRYFELIDYLDVIASLMATTFVGFVFSKNTQDDQEQLIKGERMLIIRNSILESITKAESLEPVLTKIVTAIEKEYNEMLVSILLLDESGQHLLVGAGHSLPDFYNQAINGVAIGDSVGSCGTAAYRAQRVIVKNISSHPYWQDYKELAERAELRSCWSEPIVNAAGDVLGTFAIYHREVKEPSKQDFLLIEQFAHITSIAIERDRSRQLIWQQANFDPLTKLPNRNMMQIQLKKALLVANREHRKLAIVFIDLDNFKDINDSLGHDAGDELLIEAGERIKSSVRITDTVARLGGDEFILLLENIKTDSCIEKVTEKVRASLAMPYSLKGQGAYSSASIGVTVFPDDGTELDLLLKNADQAMYGAKQQGRNTVYYFTESMRTEVLKRTSMVKDLRNALANNELFYAFQPIVDLTNGRVTKAEVLLRWRHPTLGLVSPMQFIPLAEETGLIVEFSDWLFLEVVPLVKKWRQEYQPDFQLSVNTSPVQYKSNFTNITRWLGQLSTYQLDQQAFAFEITENLLMESEDTVYQMIADIQRAGVDISIDDFGTGYSSFGYLKKHPTKFLKIDKSFVQRISENGKDLALCEAIIVMAKKMSMLVIAEGVETQAQQQILTDIGCDFGQGYHFAKPMPQDQFEQLLQQS